VLAGAGHVLHRHGWGAGEAGLTVLGAMVAVELGAALVAHAVGRRGRSVDQLWRNNTNGTRH